MRKILLYGARLLYGFLLLSVVYCTLYEMVAQDSEGAFWRSLLFLPVLTVCSVGAKRVGSAVAYGLLCLLLFAGLLWGTGSAEISLPNRVLFLCFFLCVAVSYFTARAARKRCWLEHPVYLVLLVNLFACLYGSYCHSDFLVKLSSFAAGCSYLLTALYVNDQEFGALLLDYAEMERLPVQRMQQNNSRMFYLQSGITAAVMCVMPYLKIEQLAAAALRAFQMFSRWFFGLFGRKEEVELLEQTVVQEAADYGLPPVEPTYNWFLEILDKLLEILSWVVVLSFVAAILVFVVRRLLQLYRQFNERVEENGDIVENLRNSAKNEEKLRLKKESRKSLLFYLSPDARIRKHYKKRIQRDNKEEIRSSWTPKELEEAVTLSTEQKEQFHKYYEKARYAKENCTKEEMQEMLRF